MTRVEYWQYSDGWQWVSPALVDHYLQEGKIRSKSDGFYRDGEPYWFCWVYPDNNKEFESWFADNMGSDAEATHRFNGGNPMYTVQIFNKNDAIKFCEKMGLTMPRYVIDKNDLRIL